MSRPTHASAIFFSAILCAASAPAADQPAVDWLRGSGKDLQLCLQGEVVDSDGKPATGLQLACKVNGKISSAALTPSIDGHRFKVWIPLNESPWYLICLNASSANSDRVAYKTLAEYELRQAAIDGVKLTLERPSRHLFVSATDGGRPVSSAHVKAQTRFDAEFYSTTDASGIARFNLPAREELSDLTAWTDDHRIGGFDFDRTPPRDSDAVRQAIELSRCRDQKIRFVDEQDSPVPNLEFKIQIATPPPDINYIGTIDASRMTTDAAGEAVFHWFPDWEKNYCYVDVNEGAWVIKDDPKCIDGIEVVKLKNSKLRKQIIGRVLVGATATGPGGFFVTLYSFQGPFNYPQVSRIALVASRLDSPTEAARIAAGN